MANKNLLKKVAPVILSATVAFSGMPATAFAADLSDTEVAVAAEENTDTEDAEVDVDEETADDSEVEVEEADEVDEETAEEDASEEDLFSAEEEDSVDIGDGALTGDYQYVYAGLTWAEYWASEGVYKATDTTSVDSIDEHKDPGDKGGFDAVTRATSNHGPYRASFQTITYMICSDGNTYGLDHFEGKFDDNNNIQVVLTDGTNAVYNRGKKLTVNGTTVDVRKFVMTGIKYVPVKVKTEDYEAFAAKYKVVTPGTKFSYGSSVEGNVVPYSGLEAAVTEKTNGLKTVTKNTDGSFSFSERQTGEDSGIAGQSLKEANVTPEVQPAKGNFGEFLRVDLKGKGYGDLGGAMQAVKWTYYGNDSTCTNALQTYGTKFAADNWMHSKLGIQLGLTASVRCQLPEGTDGTGYWKVTVYALGYKDYTFTFQATDANIVKPVAASTLDITALQAAVDKAEALNEKDYTATTWSAMIGELDECNDMLDVINSAKKANTTTNMSQPSIDEQITHLTEAIEKLEKLTVAVNPASTTLTVGGTATLEVNTNIEGDVTWTSSNTAVATVANGVVTAKAAGSATITVTVGGKSATCAVTVKAPEQKPVQPTQKPAQSQTQTQAPVVKAGITAKVAQVYVGKKATIKVTKTKVTGKTTFKSSNTKVATVNSKGVVTGKKAGTAKITVTVGKYKKVLTVKVKKPSFKLVRSSAKLKKGQKVTITSKAAPAAKVTYKTSNKKVATVNSKGVVTAKKKGTAKITVKCNGITKTFKVTVK